MRTFFDLGTISRASLIAISLAWTAQTHARIQPIFDLEACACPATDIVVVADDGKARPTAKVIEVWKGTLSPGDSIVVDELPVEGAPKPPVDWQQANFPDAAADGKIVLFLVHTPGPDPVRRTEGKWIGAFACPGDLKVSAAFVRNDEVLVFRQTVSPGPIFLQQWHYDVDCRKGADLAGFKRDVDDILRMRSDLDKAKTIVDPAERARALEPIAKSWYPMAEREAVPALGKCGKAGAPVLRELLKGQRMNQGPLAAALAEADPGNGEAVLADLKAELEYWKSVEPTLDAQWWQTGSDSTVPMSHRLATEMALRILGSMRFSAARPSVIDVRAFFAASPKLNTWHAGWVIRLCDEALQEMKATAAPGSNIP